MQLFKLKILPFNSFFNLVTMSLVSANRHEVSEKDIGNFVNFSFIFNVAKSMITVQLLS